MKIGDVITCHGPNDTIVSGTVVHVEPMKTRLGWNVAILPRDENHYPRHCLRPEDEGVAWIYGDAAEQIDAMRVARALGEHTEVARKPPLRVRARNKRGTL